MGELALGIAVGATLFSVTIGVLWLLGCYQVSGINSPTVLTSTLIIGSVSGFIEPSSIASAKKHWEHGWPC